MIFDAHSDTWTDVAVKTSKAKSNLKLQCSHKIKEIEQKSAINIISTIFFDQNRIES